MASFGRIFKNNDHRIKLFKVKDDDDNYLNGGNCTYVLYDYDGSVIDSGTVPYIDASNGNYRKTVDKSVLTGIVKGKKYTLVVTLESGGYDYEGEMILVGDTR